jgi:hypothetical protein
MISADDTIAAAELGSSARPWWQLLCQEAGLVSSLRRPGGNITGVTSLAVELGQKQLEVLTKLVPRPPSLRH